MKELKVYNHFPALCQLRTDVEIWREKRGTPFRGISSTQRDGESTVGDKR
jgi:hypothetical protein